VYRCYQLAYEVARLHGRYAPSHSDHRDSLANGIFRKESPQAEAERRVAEPYADEYSIP